MNFTTQQFLNLPVLTAKQAPWAEPFLLPGAQSRQKDTLMRGKQYNISARFNPHLDDVTEMTIKIT